MLSLSFHPLTKLLIKKLAALTNKPCPLEIQNLNLNLNLKVKLILPEVAKARNAELAIGPLTWICPTSSVQDSRFQQASSRPAHVYSSSLQAPRSVLQARLLPRRFHATPNNTIGGGYWSLSSSNDLLVSKKWLSASSVKAFYSTLCDTTPTEDCIIVGGGIPDSD